MHKMRKHVNIIFIPTHITHIHKHNISNMCRPYTYMHTPIHASDANFMKIYKIKSKILSIMEKK